MDKVFMLLFSFVLATPDGPRDEVLHVYSAKHFVSKEACEETLSNWSYLIKNGAVTQLNNMLKEGYEVNLKGVVCAEQPPKIEEKSAPAKKDVSGNRD